MESLINKTVRLKRNHFEYVERWDNRVGRKVRVKELSVKSSQGLIVWAKDGRKYILSAGFNRYVTVGRKQFVVVKAQENGLKPVLTTAFVVQNQCGNIAGGHDNFGGFRPIMFSTPHAADNYIKSGTNALSSRIVKVEIREIGEIKFGTERKTQYG